MARTVGLYEIRVKRVGTVCDAPKVTSPTDTLPVFCALLENRAAEHFVVVFLDARMVVIGASVVGVGSLSATVVHPREVFRLAIENGAASIVVGHNHPSGDVTPSNEDMQLTSRLVKAGELLGIEVIDHLILGDEQHLSMRTRGLM